MPTERRLVRRSALPVIVLLVLAACTRDGSARLLDVRSVAPTDVDPGDVVHVTGAGFPAGRDARVTWSGEARRAGDAPREIDVASVGRAASSDRIDVPVAGALADALAGATFRGEVRVVFAGRAGDVGGRLAHAILVVERAPARDARDGVARARRAASFARFLGVAFDEESDAGGGARLLRVASGGPAARVGLLSGDVVAAVDGAAIASREDVLPIPGAAFTRLTVRRPGTRGTAEVAVPLAGAAGEPPLSATLLALALAIAAVFVLAWLSPLAGIVDALVARTESVLRRSPRGVVHADAIYAAMLAAVFVALASHPAGAHFDLVVLGVAAAAGRVVAGIAGGGARAPRALGLAALRAIGGLAAAAGLFALLGTSALAGVADTQAHSLLAVGALRGPAQLGCALAIVEAWVVTGAPGARRGSRLARHLDHVASAAACAFVVVVALGGGSPFAAPFRALVAGGEAALLAVLAGRWRAAHETRPLVASLVGVGSALAAGLVVLADAHAADDPLLARATATTAGLTALALASLAMRPRRAHARWDLPRFL